MEAVSLRRTVSLGLALVIPLATSCGRVGLELLPGEEDETDGGGEGIDSGADDDGGLGADEGGALDAAKLDAQSAPNACLDVGDAGYQPMSCGVGYCSTTSSRSRCVGSVEIACQPGSPLASTDTTCDGVDDNCNGMADENYTPLACGVGYCRSTSKASSCTAGVETSCTPGAALRATDATCDGVDDNCSGVADENYATNSSCGVGYCKAHNTPSKCASGVETLCKPSAPLSANDATADGIDDDCDGMVDEDACVPRTDTYSFRAAVYSLIPPTGCTKATVKLWGGAGSTGSDDTGSWGPGVTGGQGGAGGYAESVLTVSNSSTIQLYVGQGAQGCAAGTTSNASYKGGAGGASNGQAGSAGADGSVTGGAGGSGGSGKGGAGSFGGGGGASGAKLYTSSGAGGDGGGATVLLLNSTRTMVAGGGAGGGGAGTTVFATGVSGANGGTGCSGNGTNSGSQGGGGGGGGVCQGTITQVGMGRTPYNAAGDLAAGAALGGSMGTSCGRGGDGYATITYAP
ncbi:MAG: putative lipoprotein [Myxococcaceae bacterium]|nr:putative lipoprotein [Myxococcaceae bacterium]